MSDILDDEGDVDWKVVMERLNGGQVVLIPCQREREFVRRATQVAKRAENHNLGVEVMREENALRVEPRPAAVAAGETPERNAISREERQEQRAKRRAERGKDG